MTFLRFWSSPYMLLAAIVLGVLCGWADCSWVNGIAAAIADTFVRLLQLVSMPIIFLSLTATLTGMSSLQTVRSLGSRVLRYTLLTTIIAASTALALLMIFDPASTTLVPAETASPTTGSGPGYLAYLHTVIPTNFIEPFLKHNVIGVLFIALFLSFATLTLAEENRTTLHQLFKSLLDAVMAMTRMLLTLIPLAVWAFVVSFFTELNSSLSVSGLMLYLLCVVLANLIQAGIVLPVLLRLKGIPVSRTLKGMWPALAIAFFSKSSSAALPTAVNCAEKNLGVSTTVSRFSLPLCITINMNACAAFIITTVLFVSMSNGISYSPVELMIWVLIATIAAIGNAGVPMGCYMLSSAMLATMDVPLYLLGMILPFYSLIDMLESAINVWSDACVTAVVDKEHSACEQLSAKEV
ncbi:dicarboxylate/amino acid:cation symporter [Spongorhabdus nitratireducens]